MPGSGFFRPDFFLVLVPDTDFFDFDGDLDDAIAFCSETVSLIFLVEPKSLLKMPVCPVNSLNNVEVGFV